MANQIVWVDIPVTNLDRAIKFKILLPRHQIGVHGFRAVVLDSEGNRIALHSR